MRALIDNYRNLTAEHCGSGAMRNLLYHYYGMELDEAVIFGLGSGLDSLFFHVADTTPPFMLFGRSVSMEQDLASALGIDYEEAIEPDDELAWQAVKEEILQGRPTMLSGDIFYLDYRNFKVHFPSHRFVLLGFDDDKGEVYIADRTNPEAEVCSMEALRLSRNPPSAITTYNQWGKFHSSEMRHSLGEACELALRKTVQRMQGSDNSQVEFMQMAFAEPSQTLAGGLAGSAQLAVEMGDWAQRDQTEAHAGYIVNAIEKFGTGGAMFRNLFTGFLQWSRQQRPELVSSTCVDLAAQGAQQWDALAEIVRPLTESSSDKQRWLQAQQQVRAVHQTETALFETLASAL